jgi:hypothetical protein
MFIVNIAKFIHGYQVDLNFHKLAIEGLKHLCFWFFGEVAGEQGCGVFDFMAH